MHGHGLPPSIRGTFVAPLPVTTPPTSGQRHPWTDAPSVRVSRRGWRMAAQPLAILHPNHPSEPILHVLIFHPSIHPWRPCIQAWATATVHEHLPPLVRVLASPHSNSRRQLARAPRRTRRHGGGVRRGSLRVTRGAPKSCQAHITWFRLGNEARSAQGREVHCRVCGPPCARAFLGTAPSMPPPCVYEMPLRRTALDRRRSASPSRICLLPHFS